jgi:hypothetical protein
MTFKELGKYCRNPNTHFIDKVFKTLIYGMKVDDDSYRNCGVDVVSATEIGICMGTFGNFLQLGTNQISFYLKVYGFKKLGFTYYNHGRRHWRGHEGCVTVFKHDITVEMAMYGYQIPIYYIKPNDVEYLLDKRMHENDILKITDVLNEDNYRKFNALLDWFKKNSPSSLTTDLTTEKNRNIVNALLGYFHNTFDFLTLFFNIALPFSKEGLFDFIDEIAPLLNTKDKYKKCKELYKNERTPPKFIIYKKQIRLFKEEIDYIKSYIISIVFINNVAFIERRVEDKKEHFLTINEVLR